MSAELFTADDALALELVDDVVAPEDLLDSALERVRALSGPPAATAQVKNAILRPLLGQLRAHEDAELQAWLDTWFSPDGRRLVGETVAALRR
jgi:enoyl-CoA hydratase/carnithine racemase